MEKSDGKVPYSDDELPEFFKKYTPAVCSESLNIPPDYIKKFDGNIPTIVTLRSPSGVSWQVVVNRINDRWVFREGWPEFVQENSLEDGDFLTFCYTGNSIFCVKIFAINGCTKRIDDTSRIHGIKPIENLQGDEASEPENTKHNRATRRKTSMARKSACSYPSFSLVMTKSHVCKGCLHIPMRFWKVYMRKHRIGSRMITLWVKNNSWPVGLATMLDRFSFSRGWRQFVKDNALQPTNLCTFQLIDENELAFKVTIDR